MDIAPGLFCARSLFNPSSKRPELMREGATRMAGTLHPGYLMLEEGHTAC